MPDVLGIPHVWGVPDVPDLQDALRIPDMFRICGSARICMRFQDARRDVRRGTTRETIPDKPNDLRDDAQGETRSSGCSRAWRFWMFERLSWNSLGECSVITRYSDARQILRVDASGRAKLVQHSDETFVFSGWTLHEGCSFRAICTMEL